MLRRLVEYRVTLVAVALLALSFVILLLGNLGVLPMDGIWRLLVLPAYLTMLFSAVLRTALPAAGDLAQVVFMLVGVALLLLPFGVIDWLVHRRRRQHRARAA